MSERANKRTSELPNTKVALSACIILHCATKRAREQIFSLLSRRAEETRTAFTFLGATKHLYKRVCPSVGQSVRPSVRPSVGPSIGPSVRRSVGNPFFSNSRNRLFPTCTMDTKWSGGTQTHTDTHTCTCTYTQMRSRN